MVQFPNCSGAKPASLTEFLHCGFLTLTNTVVVLYGIDKLYRSLLKIYKYSMNIQDVLKCNDFNVEQGTKNHHKHYCYLQINNKSINHAETRSGMTDGKV